jgi:hypothetical protein
VTGDRLAGNVAGMLSHTVAEKAQPFPKYWPSDAGWTFVGSLHDVNLYTGKQDDEDMVVVTHAWGADLVLRRNVKAGLFEDDEYDVEGVIDPDPRVTWKDIDEALVASGL